MIDIRERLLADLPILDGELRLRLCERADWDFLSEWPDYPPPLSGFQFRFAALDEKARDALFGQRQAQMDRISLTLDCAEYKSIGYIALLEIDWERAEVGNMAVRMHPDWCSRGLGVRMLRGMVEWCRLGGIQLLRLDVAASNERAVRAYEKVGFHQYREVWRVDEKLTGVDLEAPEYRSVRAHIRFNQGKPETRFWFMEWRSQR